MRCRNCGWENPDNCTSCEKCGSPLEMNAAQAPQPAYTPQSNHAPESSIRSTVRESVYFDTPQEVPASQRHQVENPQPAINNVCPRCGFAVHATASRCPACGAPVAAAQPAQPQAYQQPTAREPQPAFHPQPVQPTPQPVQPQPARQATGKICSKCGNVIVPGARFCGFCGQAVRQAMGTIGAWDAPVEVVKCSLAPIPFENEAVLYEPVIYTGEEIILNRDNTDTENQTITSKQQAVLIHEGDNWYIEDRSARQSTMIHVRGRVKLKDGDIILLGNRKFEFKS